MLPTYLIKCVHCGHSIRVVTTGYGNVCPICSNVLPPRPDQPRDSVTTSEGMVPQTEDETVNLTQPPPIATPPPIPVAPPPPLIPAIEDGVDLGNMDLNMKDDITDDETGS